MKDTQTPDNVADLFCSQCDSPAVGINQLNGAARCGEHLEIGCWVFDDDCIEMLKMYYSLPTVKRRVVRGMLKSMYGRAKAAEANR